VDGR